VIQLEAAIVQDFSASFSHTPLVKPDFFGDLNEVRL
jgi:hypothetical protein